MRKRFYLLSLVGLLIAAGLTWLWLPAVVLLIVVLGVVLLGVHDILQTKHSIKRNFPVGGHGRWFMEWLRPMIFQYFVESDTDGPAATSKAVQLGLPKAAPHIFGSAHCTGPC